MIPLPAIGIGAVALVAGLGAWWVTSTVAENARLERETTELRQTVGAYDEALKAERANRAAIEAALERASEQTARLAADRAAILEDLRHAEFDADCPVPDAVGRAVDRLWTPDDP